MPTKSSKTIFFHRSGIGEDEETAIETFHSYLPTGKLQSLQIYSAFSSPEWVQKVIKSLEKRLANNFSFQLYIDFPASGVSSSSEVVKKYKAAEKTMKRLHFSSDSGIYFVHTKRLFHTKLYVCRTANKVVCFTGSANFSESAFGQNWEIICNLDLEKSEKISDFVNDKFLAELKELGRVYTLDDLTRKILVPSSPRDVFLMGRLFYTYSKSQPFRFSLGIPEEFRMRASQVDPLISDVMQDSIDLLAAVGLKFDLQDASGTSERWKKYTVQTSYGFWCPHGYLDSVRSIVDQSVQYKISRARSVVNLFVTRKSELMKRVGTLILNIKESLGDSAKEWERADFLMDTLNSRFEKICEQSQNERFIRRLAITVEEAKVPDIWEDAVAQYDFEASFCDAIRFFLNVPHRNISNLVARSIREFKPDIPEEDEALLNAFKTVVAKNRLLLPKKIDTDNE